MAKPLSLWKRTRRCKTDQFVGTFFHSLAKSLLKAHYPAEGNEDLCMRVLGAAVEVKGGDNNHPIRIRVDQFERYRDSLGASELPYDHLLYVICCYTNSEMVRGKNRSQLAMRRKSELGVYQLLAENAHKVYVFDHRIIEAVTQHLGVATGSFPEAKIPTVNLTRRFLAGFNPLNAPHMFDMLGFNARRWNLTERQAHITVQIVGVHPTVFSVPVKLNVVEVLPADLVREFTLAIKAPVTQPMRRTIRITPVNHIDPMLRMPVPTARLVAGAV